MNYTQQYYNERPSEPKHFLESVIWIDYFNPKKILDAGCGHGHRVLALNYHDADAYGFDLQLAIDTSPYKEFLQNKLKAGDILNIPFDNNEFDLVIVYDVLEHLEPEELDKALAELKRVCSKNIVFSIPFIGDPNLYKDPTHKIFRTQEWWIYKIQEYFNIKETPRQFLFYPQMVVGEK